MRTFSRAAWEAAQQAWADGEFSPEWKPFRHQAAMRGMIFPPEGTKWDTWDEPEPSQRAMLIRAIRETPALLRRAIDRSRSWSQVLDIILAQRDDQAEMAARDDSRPYDGPDPREALVSLKRIVTRIADS